MKLQMPPICLMKESVFTVVLPPDFQAKGESRGGKKTVVRKGGKKTSDRILELARKNPKITFADMVAALGISRSAIQKHVAHLKDAQLLRRIGPAKGGSWEVVGGSGRDRGDVADGRLKIAGNDAAVFVVR